jgi:hypothetical protein
MTKWISHNWFPNLYYPFHLSSWEAKYSNLYETTCKPYEPMWLSSTIDGNTHKTQCTIIIWMAPNEQW